MKFTDLQIAQLAYEVNRAYCIATGDASQQPWEESEQHQRDSTLRGIRIALAGATPQEQHEAWMKDRLADGWVHGEVKDAVAKTHPALLPYDQLPAEQKVKDFLYIAVVKTASALLSARGGPATRPDRPGRSDPSERPGRP